VGDHTFLVISCTIKYTWDKLCQSSITGEKMKKLISITLLTALSSMTAYQAHAVPSSLVDQQDGSWSLQATLSQKKPKSGEAFSVALSADGSTLAVGAPGFNDNAGATQIYGRNGSRWSYQTTLTDGIQGSQEGSSVALSADGKTLASGAKGFNNGNGETQIYIKTASGSWSFQATLTQNITNSLEGYSVALSADGNTLAVGAEDFSSSIPHAGATHIYSRSGTTWIYQATLTQNALGSHEGCSVALSADGNTLAAGAFRFDSSQNDSGATQIYVRSKNIWTHQATLSQNLSQTEEGTSVALSSDATTLAAGAYNATQIYVRSGSTWSHQATLTQNITTSLEGSSVALSADGNTLAAGDPIFNTFAGATQIYSRSVTTWSHAATLTQATGALDAGSSVALSTNATTLAAGAPGYTNFPHQPGVTFVYVNNDV
jgi:hypothetical protein